MTDIKQLPSRYSRHHWHPDLYRLDNVEALPTEKRKKNTISKILFLFIFVCRWRLGGSSNRSSSTLSTVFVEKSSIFNGYRLDVISLSKRSCASDFYSRRSWWVEHLSDLKNLCSRNFLIFFNKVSIHMVNWGMGSVLSYPITLRMRLTPNCHKRAPPHRSPGVGRYSEILSLLFKKIALIVLH